MPSTSLAIQMFLSVWPQDFIALKWYLPWQHTVEKSFGLARSLRADSS